MTILGVEKDWWDRNRLGKLLRKALPEAELVLFANAIDHNPEIKKAADIKTAGQLDLPTPTAVYHNAVAAPTDIAIAV